MTTKLLTLNPDELLTTTRAVRYRLDFDRPVEMSLIRECLEIALQAPSGSLRETWHFLIVTDRTKRRKIADLYRKGIAETRAQDVAERQANPTISAHEETLRRMRDSAYFLADNLERAPAYLIPCIEGRPEAIAETGQWWQLSVLYGSIMPAFWSFMLAARARGLGTSWTCAHLIHEAEAADILSIDYGKITQCGLAPIAYSKGTDFKPGPRKPLDPILHIDRW
jgi:nitroreductase